MSPDFVSTKPLLDKLGVKPGMRVVVLELDDGAFLNSLRKRTLSITRGKPRGRCDIVFMGAKRLADLQRLSEIKHWIEPNGAIWVIRPKGGRSEIRDTDLINAGLSAGLVDNKIASFSETHGAMRFVFRLRDRSK